MAAVLVLAGSSIFFANRTTVAARTLMERGIVGSDIATRLSMLLQTHKGLVDSIPAELDRNRLDITRRKLVAMERQLKAETGRWHPTKTGAEEPWAEMVQEIAPQLPELYAAGQRVLALAHDFAQDQALEEKQGPYATVSDRLLGRIGFWQDTQRQAMDEQIGVLLATSGAMSVWVFGITAATLLTGLLAFMTTAGVLGRLRLIREAMLQLARRENGVDVPYLSTPDEIGAMARAVQVFKVNAALVAEQQEELRRVNGQAEAALSTMSQGLCLWDASGRLQMFNEQFCTVVGFEPGTIRTGQTIRDVVQAGIDAGHYPGMTIEEALARVEAIAASNTPLSTVQEFGDGRVIAVSYRPRPDGGCVATYEDVTIRREAEKRLAFMARHDALTGLPNRVVLQERLEHVVATTRHGAKAAVLCLDLDEFKAVNDTLGHPIGDALLCAVAGRLVGCIRETDVVIRLGGDEFAIIQTDIVSPEDAQRLAERINLAVSEPYTVQSHKIVVGVSIGIAMLPVDGEDATTALRNADLALYRSKSDGRGGFCFFERAMDERMQHRRALEMDLRMAMLEGEFELYYQPLVNLAQAQVSGFEALMRWNHPARGMVSPCEFIPVAEELGLIVPLGAWAIQTACNEAAHWPSWVKVAVNLSPTQFKGEGLVTAVRQALDASGLTPSRLELEITESVLLQNSTHTLAVLHELRALGVRVSLDDFGTGYSSLSYLQSFPFDKVKIDQSFIRGLSCRDGSIHIVRAVHSLCSGIGMVMTAEGVETREQLAILRAEGCMEIQGYLFSKPREAKEVPNIIQTIGIDLGKSDPPLDPQAWGMGARAEAKPFASTLIDCRP